MGRAGGGGPTITKTKWVRPNRGNFLRQASRRTGGIEARAVSIGPLASGAGPGSWPTGAQFKIMAISLSTISFVGAALARPLQTKAIIWPAAKLGSSIVCIWPAVARVAHLYGRHASTRTNTTCLWRFKILKFAHSYLGRAHQGKPQAKTGPGGGGGPVWRHTDRYHWRRAPGPPPGGGGRIRRAAAT